MHVVATAGHVDHGKSTLVRALTGMEPDRWAEERRRGMTIDLGFAWTSLPSGAVVAFVDVPGHERFVPNMLAGVGPVPAVLLVVAADEGWRRQSTEHLAAIEALGVRHGLLVVSRCDLADPGPAVAQARAHLSGTDLQDIAAVAVSGRTGAGLHELRAQLDILVAGLPSPRPEGDVRLWVDRSFVITGAGTVVTGTLAAGRLSAGDRLVLASTGAEVRVRGLQSLGRDVGVAAPVSRIAVNLRGVDHHDVRRGDALLTRDAWLRSAEVDVRLPGPAGGDVRATSRLTLHVGTAAVAARVRPLGDDVVRLRLAHPLPLRVGDRGLLREPGGHDVVGIRVLDPSPPALVRRGDAARRARDLRGAGPHDVSGEVRRRRVVHRDELRRLGVGTDPAEPAPPEPLAGGWLVDPPAAAALADGLAALVADQARRQPDDPGVALAAAATALGLPDAQLVAALPSLAARGLAVADGRVRPADVRPQLPARLSAPVGRLRADLATDPFAAPAAGRLAELGLGHRELATARRAGALLVLPGGVVLLPDAPDRAREALRGLDQPFTVSTARRAWGTSRRVALPLLDLLDRTGVTERLPDDSRRLSVP